MSIRQRTTKLVARRHDLNYFKRLSPLRAWQFWLAGAALIAAVVWFSGSEFLHGAQALSAGPMSNSHAVFATRCELCHVPVVSATGWTPSFGMRRHVPDSACLQCHTAPAHHPMETKEAPTCGSCHTEHIGAMHLAAVADKNCTQCHAQLQSRNDVLHVARSVSSFATNHPEFQPLREARDADKRAATALVFNHAEHMKAGLKGPTGPVTLECATCHVAVLNAEGRHGRSFAPVPFERSCRSCHALQFDAHIQAEAPHGKVEDDAAFVTKSITEFAHSHPELVSAEIRNWPAETPLPGRAAMPPPHSTQEWIANRIARADTILWRERCGLCHKAADGSVAFANDPNNSSKDGAMALPVFAPVSQPQHWLSSAVFSHPAHQAVACAECHTQALSSASEHEVMMPSIATCRRCHDGRSSPQGPAVAAGHAESGCFLCHVYHGPEQAGLTTRGLSLREMLRQ
jgi:hypothetical protein